MKIVCENCSAKYSIADEKVRGKVFKIRCKKCGESIVVRGDVPESAPAEAEPQPQAQAAPPPLSTATASVEDDEYDAQTKVFDYSAYRDDESPEPEWHIVVEGEQQGPYSEAQIGEFLEAGSIDVETYIWKEGFSDWLQIGAVPELASNKPASEESPFVEAPAGEPAAQQRNSLFDEPASATGGNLFDQPASGGLFGDSGTDNAAIDGGAGLFSSSPEEPTAGGDFFSSTSPSAPESGGLFSGESGGDQDGGGLFSAPGSEAEAGAGGDIFGDLGSKESDDSLFSSAGAPAASPRVSAEQAMMTGQRNENSVLFSLSNLQALAADSDGPSAGPAAAAAPGAAPAPTGGGEEASGLIDIRSLAGSLTEEKSSDVDDLLSIGGGGGFGPALGAPVLTAAQPAGMSTGVKIAIAAGGIAFVAIVGVAILYLGGKSDKDQSNAEAQIAALEEKIKQMAAGGATASEMRAAKDELEQKIIDGSQANSNEEPANEENADEKDTAASSAQSDASTKTKGSTSRKGRSKSKSAGGSGSSSSGSAAASSSGSSSGSSSSGTKSSSSKPSSGSNELDDLLGGAAPKTKTKPKTTKPKETSSSSSSTSGGVKEQLSRADVQQGMRGVSSKVKVCGGGQTGTIIVRVVIGGTGRVISAVATGNFGGTPVGNCAARAVRKARFPKSQKEPDRYISIQIVGLDLF